jgi:uncharacterized protein (DUF1697 family)
METLKEGLAPGQTYVALLRGINVGRAKRIRMAALRHLLMELGYADVRTLLNSGNALFRAPGIAEREVAAPRIAGEIEAGIMRRFGFAVRVMVLDTADLAAVMADDPLLPVTTDPSRHMVAFVADPATLERARALLGESWAPDALAVGRQAAYLWCARGVIASRLMQAFARLTGEEATVRNWATVIKLRALLDGGAA